MTRTKTIFSGVAIVLLIISTGCSGLVGGSGPTEETATPAQTPESTPTATPTLTPEPTEATPVATEAPETETKSDSGELAKAEKFEKFDENVHRLYRIDNDSVTLVQTETYPRNDSYHLTVKMRDTTNRTKTVEDRLDPLWKYYAIVEDYNYDDTYPDRGHTYIPDTVNVTFLREDGKKFQTSYIKYIWAYNYANDEWSLRVLMGKYSTTLNEGPAYHNKWE